jgi:hypothetical protein
MSTNSTGGGGGGPAHHGTHSLLALCGEPATVEYTEREEDCHEWIESCVVRAGETVARSRPLRPYTP